MYSQVASVSSTCVSASMTRGRSIVASLHPSPGVQSARLRRPIGAGGCVAGSLVRIRFRRNEIAALTATGPVARVTVVGPVGRFRERREARTPERAGGCSCPSSTPIAMSSSPSAPGPTWTRLTSRTIRSRPRPRLTAAAGPDGPSREDRSGTPRRRQQRAPYGTPFRDTSRRQPGRGRSTTSKRASRTWTSWAWTCRSSTRRSTWARFRRCPSWTSLWQRATTVGSPTSGRSLTAACAGSRSRRC